MFHFQLVIMVLLEWFKIEQFASQKMGFIVIYVHVKVLKKLNCCLLDQPPKRMRTIFFPNAQLLDVWLFSKQHFDFSLLIKHCSHFFGIDFVLISLLTTIRFWISHLGELQSSFLFYIPLIILHWLLHNANILNNLRYFNFNWILLAQNQGSHAQFFSWFHWKQIKTSPGHWQ